MAVAGRRAVLLGLLAAPGALAQQPERGNEEPLRALFGLAELQARASRLAASRETRPEVKGFAGEMAGWRAGQVQRLRAFLEARGIRDPAMPEDQATVWEGMERLDFLALSRRYAEVQVEALELEIAGYERAGTASDPGILALAAETLPELRRRLEAARRVHDAVKP